MTVVAANATQNDGPTAVADGVELVAFRTPTLPPATHTNSVALGERDVVLVEPATPYPDERRRFVAWGEQLRAQGRRLLAVLVTHHHWDHVAGATALSRELGLPLWGHALTADKLPHTHFERRLVDGESLLLDGPTPQRWDVLHTPGHAPGHLCFVERALGVGVVGDMVAGVGTILIEPGDGDLAEYLRQLERLATLGLRAAVPAHGPVQRSPSELFLRTHAHRLAREARVRAALSAEPRGIGELVALAYADKDRALWPLAERSLRAHLEKLERDGVARRTADGAYTGG